jgi:hypothetical protein
LIAGRGHGRIGGSRKEAAPIVEQPPEKNNKTTKILQLSDFHRIAPLPLQEFPDSLCDDPRQ